MGVAYYIVLERNIHGIDTAMNGKFLAHESEALDALATESGIKPLSSFISTDPQEALAFMQDQGLDIAGVQLPPLEFFSAQEGLDVVRALLLAVENARGAIGKDKGVLHDLRECEVILKEVQKVGVRWRFAVDF